MYKIEVIGMRKKRNKIALAAIILTIIVILSCLCIFFINKNKTVEVSKTEISETRGLNSGIEVSSENNNNIKNQVEQNGQVDTIQGIQSQNQTNKVEINTEKFIDSINNIYNGTEGKRVFLTFDDGPTNEVTPHILDILEKYNIKATFFVLGNRVEANPGLIRREYEEGHYIANHGYSHKYKELYKSVDSVFNEYNKTENAIRNALGNQNYSSYLFRFPGGSHGGPYEKIKCKARTQLNKAGVAYLDWSALTYDAEGANTKEEILNNLKSTINGWNNVVILMHDAADKQITYQTLEDVIKYLQKQGYKFENIYNLMEE